MSIQRLKASYLRNLDQVDFQPSPRVNLIFGQNGSGKTSILEAIHLLGVGRSFRSHKHRSLINYHQSEFTVFGRVTSDLGADLALGVSRSQNGDFQFRANGQAVASAADLAHYLPLQVINSDTFGLLEGGPQVRRQFIDWLVFHVEPGFYPLWRNLQRCLKHRNSLLRHDRMDALEMAPWDQELIALTEQIHTLRSSSIESFNAVFHSLASVFTGLEGLALNYFRGWDRQMDYAEVLEKGLERDRRQGFTQAGSHRADLRINFQGQNAVDLLSRGQQKLLVCALKVAQGLVFQSATGRRCIYLVDDLPAELDIHHRQMLTDWLESMDTQVFITGVEPQALLETWLGKSELEIKMFHVEQGKLKETDEYQSPR